MSFQELKVSTRLAIGFAVLLLVSIVIAALGITKLASLNESLVVTVDFNAQESNIIALATGEAQKASTAMRNLIVLNDVPRMTVQKQAFDNSLRDYDKAIGDLEKLFARDPNTSAEEKAYLVKIDEVKKSALPSVTKAA